MRISTCNVNGLRSAASKGFVAWMLAEKPDVACVQEIKAREIDLHREIDVKNWKKIMTTTGFLQPERDWLTRVFEEHGFVDVFRAVDPSPDRFTWWLTFGHARERNLGWRIDYQVATPGIAKKARCAAIFTETWFSDHAPVTIDYDYKIAVTPTKSLPPRQE